LNITVITQQQTIIPTKNPTGPIITVQTNIVIKQNISQKSSKKPAAAKLGELSSILTHFHSSGFASRANGIVPKTKQIIKDIISSRFFNIFLSCNIYYVF
jgi:hypothetical protein